MKIDFNDVNQIPDMSKADVAFGNGYKYMPDDSEVPQVDEKWSKLFSTLFYGTLSVSEQVEFDMKDNFTKETGEKYWRFIQSVMKSYGPKHQHKERFCAYLFSCWLKDWTIEPIKRAPELGDNHESKVLPS